MSFKTSKTEKFSEISILLLKSNRFLLKNKRNNLFF